MIDNNTQGATILVVTHILFAMKEHKRSIPIKDQILAIWMLGGYIDDFEHKSLINWGWFKSDYYARRVYAWVGLVLAVCFVLACLDQIVQPLTGINLYGN